METTHFINIKYNYPSSDFEECLNFYPDGTLNIPFSLSLWKDKLLKITKNIDTLIKHHDKINILNIDSTDFIGILINDQEIEKELENNEIIIKYTYEDDDNHTSDDEEEEEIIPELWNEPETNHQRLTALTNIINKNNEFDDIIENNFSDLLNSSTEKNIIDDLVNQEYIIDKLNYK